MTKILIGFLLVFLDYTFSPQKGVVIEILPDFIGYALVVIGALQLRKDGSLYAVLAISSIIMTAFSGLTYSQGVMAVALSERADVLLSALALIGSFIVAILFLLALRQAEQKYQSNFGSGDIRSALWFMAVTTVLAFVFQILPVMGIIGIMIGFLGNMFFLFELGRTRNKYRNFQVMHRT